MVSSQPYGTHSDHNYLITFIISFSDFLVNRLKMCYNIFTQKRRKRMYQFHAFLNRMKYIRRWSLMRSVQEENIMEHSWQVTTIAHALALIANRIYGKSARIETVLLYAQYHETSEVITGDLPTPIKYFNPEILAAYKGLEAVACEKLLTYLPPELREDYRQAVLPDTDTYEYRLVKAADRLAAYLKCLEELNAGNAEFKKAKASIEKDLKNLDMKEVDYFLKQIAPAYSLTLDELD